MRTAITAALAAGIVSMIVAPPAHADGIYTIGGDLAITTTWGPADCIQLNWPTDSEPVCNASHTYTGHQYNIQPGQVIGVDPDISGNQFVACTVIDLSSGRVVFTDSGTLGDGHDINCLGNTGSHDVERQAT